MLPKLDMKTTKFLPKRGAGVLSLVLFLFLLDGLYNFYQGTEYLKVNDKTRGVHAMQNKEPTNSSIIRMYDDSLPYRSFVPWNQTKAPLPCIIDNDRESSWDTFNGYIQNQPSDSGLLFIKIEKAASTSLAGVSARIARAIAHKVDANVTRLTPEDGLGTTVPKICKSRSLHLWSKRTKKFSTRNKEQSFLWTFLKDPTKRLLSIYFYFIVDLTKQNYTDDGLIDFFRESYNREEEQLFVIGDHDPRVIASTLSDEELNVHIQKTIDEFNFIGLVERMDESLVLLQLMLDLRPSDVSSVSSSKIANTFSMRKQRCVRFGYKRNIFPRAQEFLDSDEYRNMSKIEYMLYESVNRSIDHTIESVIGRDKFDVAMEEFQKVKEKIQQHCRDFVSNACTSNGTHVKKRPKCYINPDIGCGYECLDDVYPIEYQNDQKILFA